MNSKATNFPAVTMPPKRSAPRRKARSVEVSQIPGSVLANSVASVASVVPEKSLTQFYSAEPELNLVADPAALDRFDVYAPLVHKSAELKATRPALGPKPIEPELLAKMTAQDYRHTTFDKLDEESKHALWALHRPKQYESMMEKRKHVDNETLSPAFRAKAREKADGDTYSLTNYMKDRSKVDWREELARLANADIDKEQRARDNEYIMAKLERDTAMKEYESRKAAAQAQKGRRAEAEAKNRGAWELAKKTDADERARILAHNDGLRREHAEKMAARTPNAIARRDAAARADAEERANEKERRRVERREAKELALAEAARQRKAEADRLEEEARLRKEQEAKRLALAEAARLRREEEERLERERVQKLAEETEAPARRKAQEQRLAAEQAAKAAEALARKKKQDEKIAAEQAAKDAEELARKRKLAQAQRVAEQQAEEMASDSKPNAACKTVPHRKRNGTVEDFKTCCNKYLVHSKAGPDTVRRKCVTRKVRM